MPTGRVEWGGFVGLLDEVDRRAFLCVGRPRRYRAGQSLMLAGDRSDHVLCLVDGGAKISIDTVDGHELLLGLRGPGDLIGELAAVDAGGSTRSANVVALGPLDTVVMTGQEFRSFLAEHRGATEALTVMLVRRLRQADRKRIEFGSLDTPRRVAHVLVEMAESHGRAVDDGVLIDLPLSQEEVAGLISASRESVARGLAGLRERSLISTGRRAITVRDLDGLRRYARTY
jgi:CRP-like cAMP-binding protein